MKEGWKYKRLGDVATYINGFAFKPEDWTTEGLPIIRIQNLTESNKVYNYCKRKDIPAKFHVFDGDVLISWSATLGVFEWSGGEALLNQHIFKVVFDKEEINKQYYKYAIMVSIAEMSKHTNGATMRHIRKGDFDNIQIPVPPLPEQQRIVELLDAEFAKIDSIRANADQQLRAAKDLFQVALNEMITPNLDWKEKVMRDICDVTDYVANGSFATLKENVKYHSEPNYAVLVRLADYSSNFDQSKFVYVDEHSYRFLSKSTLYGGEIIMSNVGSVGKCFICPFLGQPMTLGPNSILIRIDNSKFYMYYFRSAMFLEKLKTITNQATLSKFNKTQFRSLKIQVPDSSTQNRIVNKLDALSEKVARLQENYDKTLTLCNDLKQKLLKSIFE